MKQKYICEYCKEPCYLTIIRPDEDWDTDPPGRCVIDGEAKWRPYEGVEE